MATPPCLTAQNVPRGPRQYTYATAGDLGPGLVGSPQQVHLQPDPLAHFDRNTICAGIKGLVLDSEFKSQHSLGPGVIADTLFTNPDIDWRDTYVTDLENPFPFHGDEFVNGNISSRPTPIIEQECVDGPGRPLRGTHVLRGLPATTGFANASGPKGILIGPPASICRESWMTSAELWP